MAGQLRAIKRRIGSVQSTQKITRAMELIASSRIVKAQAAVNAARPYAEEMRRLMASVSKSAGSIDSPLLKERDEIKRVATVIISSDRGLAGAYNSNIIRAAERDIKERGKDSKLFLVGKKAVTYFKFRGHDTSDSWQGISERPKIGDARRVATAAVESFIKGEVDEVRLAYTKFESALIQRPIVVKLLPMPKEEFSAEETSDGPTASYEFEPAPEDILDLLLPRYVEGTILQGLLEAAASEHAARRRAMKAATDNAEELIANLARVYNQARQAEITTEIMEVIGGAEALGPEGK
jgi:F-type H+-transporting ATPase subunit gamma